MTGLNFIRGLVRPAVLVGLLTVNLGMLVAGVFISEAREYIFQAVAIIEGPTLLALGFWFKERGDRLPEDDNAVVDHVVVNNVVID